MDKMSVADKQKRIAEIFHHSTPDAIFVMSADIIKAPPGRTKSGYKSPSYRDVDIRGLLSGGKARVIAAAEAYKYFQNRSSSPIHVIAMSLAVGQRMRVSMPTNWKNLAFGAII